MVELHEAEKPILAIIDIIFVSQCPVSTLDWLPNFPHKVWVDPGEGSFTFQVSHREWESNRELHACVAMSNNGAYETLNEALWLNETLWWCLETLNEKDYFGRKATFTALSEIHVVNSRIRHFLALTRQRPQGFFLGLRALEENRLEPYSTNMMFTKNVTQKHVLTHKKTQKLCV